MELLVEQRNDEKVELERRVMVMRMEAEELDKELNRMRSLVKKKELAATKLQLELRSLDEAEKEGLRKQVLQLRSEIKKKEDACKILEWKTRDRATSKPVVCGSKEASNKIKLLQCEIKLKESALEKSAHAFSEKEKIIHKRIEELEERLNVNEVEKKASSENLSTTSSVNSGAILSRKCNDLSDSSDNAEVEDLKKEMGLIMERNKSMEKELKEMEERYSDMNLKFAEVKGERQQLVMKLRNLTNAKNSTNLFCST